MKEAKLRTLLGIQRQLAEFRDLQPLLDYALEASLILFTADTCSVLLLHENQTKEYLSTQVDDETSCEISDLPLLEWTSQTKKASSTPDESSTQAPVTIAAPILFWGQVRGAVCLTRSPEPPFTSEDVDVLQLFADQLGVAIENARANERLATAVATQKELINNLEKQIDAVSTLIMGDLREPVGVIASFASLLEEYAGVLNTEEQKLAARTIRTMSKKMDDLGVRLLYLTNPEKQEAESATAVTAKHTGNPMDTKPLKPLNTMMPIT